MTALLRAKKEDPAKKCSPLSGPSFLEHCMKEPLPSPHPEMSKAEIIKMVKNKTEKQGLPVSAPHWGRNQTSQGPALLMTREAFTTEDTKGHQDPPPQILPVSAPQVLVFADTSCLSPYPLPASTLAQSPGPTQKGTLSL